MDDLTKYFDYLLNKKNIEFDSFTPFQGITLSHFKFIPSRFEVWQNGQMSSSGKFNGVIEAMISPFDSNDVTIVISDKSIAEHILQEFKFSICFTQKDRIQLAEIPPAQSNDCNGLNMLRMVTGDTCEKKTFGAKEPYCAGIFLQNGVVKKMTFSFNIPVRLIEFYE
ncbi:MAG: hypothetical protein ACK4NY_18005 [Spirosomataceae bacterium]